MFPAAFDYQSPTTLDEALGVLAKRGDDAKVMAGGQSLIPLLKLRFAQPALILDIGRIPGLADIKRDDGHVRAGALARHVDIERSDELAKLVPPTVKTVPWIAHPLDRNRRTLPGTVCHPHPSDAPPSLRPALTTDLAST